MKNAILQGIRPLIAGGAVLALMPDVRADLLNFQYKHVPGQVIVKFKEGMAVDQQLIIQQSGGEVAYTFADGSLLVKLGAELSTAALREKAEALEQSELIASVEANTILGIAAKTPNDPRYASLWGLEKIAAPAAWERSTGSPKAVVAVIDTGIAYNHPDLKGNYWQNPGETGVDSQGRNKADNGIDDDGNGYTDDWRGWDFVNNDNDPYDDHRHGTHCAGTIGALGNNSLGVVGVNWQVALVGLKFLDAQGSGSLDNAIKAIDYATSLGVFLTSNSWGGGGYSPAMESAIQRAANKGILFVAAAGNLSSDNDRNPHYPSNYKLPNVLAVAASNADDALAAFSQYGKTSVHLAAPGENILSTVPPDQYASLSGTSMATPHVAGALALMKAAFPEQSALALKNKLLQTVDPLAAFMAKTSSGGRLNIFNALDEDATPPGVVRQMQILSQGLTSLTLQFEPTGDDGDEGQVNRYELRIASQPINDERAWEQAQLAILQPLRDAKSYLVEGLTLEGQGYLAVRAWDNAGNRGAISESLAFQLQKVQVYAAFNGESKEGMVFQDPWAIEEQKQGEEENAYYSDSPGAKYANHADTALTFPIIALQPSEAFMQLEVNHDLEYRFDFVYLEISLDRGKSWREIANFTGQSNGWSIRHMPLKGYLPEQAASVELMLRLRLHSDYSIAGDGIKLDNLIVAGPKV